MAFEDIKAEIALLFEQMVNQPQDAHEIRETVREKLNALKAEGAVKEVIGVGRSEASLRRACELGVIDRAATSMAAAVTGADVVVLAAPVAHEKEGGRRQRDHEQDKKCVGDLQP